MATQPTTTPEAMLPPRSEVGIIGWLHANLFSNWYNTALTLVSGLALLLGLWFGVKWVLVEADWTVEVQDLSAQQAHDNPSDVVTLDFPDRPTEARLVCADPCGYHLMRATVTARYQGKSASFSINCRFG